MIHIDTFNLLILLSSAIRVHSSNNVTWNLGYNSHVKYNVMKYIFIHDQIAFGALAFFRAKSFIKVKVIIGALNIL